MKSDSQLLKENLEKNYPEMIRTGDDVITTVHCGCGYSGKAVMEVKDSETDEWYAYCKCEM